jgi:chorismate--pyruvate lyase
LDSHRHALVREVLLHCSGTPLVLARSIIPQEALQGGQCRLAHLGDRPLGELLFSYRKLRRESLELARIDPPYWCAPLVEQLGLSADVWGRRSVYRVAKGRILVCEFFLPAVLNLRECET